MSRYVEQLEKFRSHSGAFIAALDQSGGSTPKALKVYGLDEKAWSNEDEMFELVHQMRTRIITNPVFTGERIVACILFENTMDRNIEGKGSADYLWQNKGIIPILKVDKGLAEEEHGVQCMKPIPQLNEALNRAIGKNIFGTKMRSVIKDADPIGITRLVEQQFTIAMQIIIAGLVPIIEPEIDIYCPLKNEAEVLLKRALLSELNNLAADELVIFKLTPPEEENFYLDLIHHPNVVKVVALSGGYPRDEANARLSKQHLMVASFSRALTEGLSAHQSGEAFTQMLDRAIDSIYEASST